MDDFNLENVSGGDIPAVGITAISRRKRAPSVRPKARDANILMRVTNVCMKATSIFFLAVARCFLPQVHGQGARPLTLSRTISLPNVQGGFNHMSVDAGHQRLFAAAPTNNTVEIIDLRSGKPWRSLGGESPAAVRFAPEFNQLYVSHRSTLPRDGGQSVYIYDGQSFGLLTKIDLGSRLDELQYNARAKQLYVGCMTAGKTAIAVIGIPEGKLLGKVPLPASPQGIAVEQEGMRIFANVPGLRQIAVIDREKRTLLKSWPLRDVQGNTPIGLDEADYRLFVGTRQPARLVVFNTVTGKPIAEVAIHGGADDLFYDPAHRRIYVSCGEGFIDVIEQRNPDRYQLEESIPTVTGAGTSTFSAQLNSFYLGVPRRGSKPAEIRVFRVGK
jgi:DNA-binding beta-propeller fold protein YncE